MSNEAGVLVGTDGLPIHWHVPYERTAVLLPDSRDLWDVMWEFRDSILGFAHSHPGQGIPSPSQTDLTTFAAIEAALGIRLHWWITSEDFIIDCVWKGPDKYSYSSVPSIEYDWVGELRRISDYFGV